MDFPSLKYVDIIGDVHGCFDELVALLGQLGYETKDDLFIHPDQRKLVFVGDLCDRGPKSLDVLTLVKRLVDHNLALHCPGNHDDKLMRYCQGRKVQVKHGLETTVKEIEKTKDPIVTREWIEAYIKNLPLYLKLDHGNLVVAHAGIPSDRVEGSSKRLREVCLFGFPTGRLDKHGLPERDPVIKHYRGKALLVHGHTPIRDPEWEKNVINIDTGCVFGGKLTCFRYPESEFVSIDAYDVYGESKRFKVEK